MSAGFNNFKELFNNKQNAIRWDIRQLKSEQQALQSIREKYLSDQKSFNLTSKYLTSDKVLGYLPNPLSDKHTQPGGINILNYGSRVQYGCKILGYTEKQGCTP
ncbi:hypothetical protein LVJ83_10985 [Uruburuella testudinis]|uniref:Uncharacterized protein n=1 Tax=Uruburuella testudinis TaxID=1282863 RepID=A0ABY4DRV2_9NEIS|nr:hypothetical protein [Uruburuella testudinis]UOO81464.1 hypothetical protein LVJ83_10985 [Uruburuella testudinis]